MPDTFTTNLNLTKPEIGASDDTWGNKSNTNWDAVDSKYGAGAGTHVLRDVDSELNLPGLKLSGAAATVRKFRLYTSTSLRWLFGADATAEGGANAGSDFSIQGYADDGVTLLGTFLKIVRATGVAVFSATPLVGANPVLAKGGNDDYLVTPVGVVLPFSLSALPSAKWVFPSGQALLRASYPDLWTAAQVEIAAGNTDWTVGNGSTTFTIPDYSNYSLVGRDVSGSNRITTAGSGIDGTKLGATGGAQNVVLGQVNLPNVTFNGTDSRTWSFPANLSTTTGPFAVLPGGNNIGGSTTIAVNPSSTAISVSSGGSGTAVNKMPPSKVVNFILRALP